jgi:rhodanese-related sulfurtransferase
VPEGRLGVLLAAMLCLFAAPSHVAADRFAGSIANRDAARWYEQGAPALFVDLRTAGERAQGGRLARALWVPLRAARDVSARDAVRLGDEVLRAVAGDRTRTIVLVCAEGVKALAAAEALRTNGFRSVLVVEGGLWAGEPWLAFDLE